MNRTRMAGIGVDGITIGAGICSRCQHVKADGLSCDAYPDGIPAMILIGQLDHRTELPGDRGIQFKKREGD